MEKKCRKLKILAKLPENVQSQSSNCLYLSLQSSKNQDGGGRPFWKFENSKIIVLIYVIHVEWLFLGCRIYWWCLFYHSISGFFKTRWRPSTKATSYIYIYVYEQQLVYIEYIPFKLITDILVSRCYSYELFWMTITWYQTAWHQDIFLPNSFRQNFSHFARS